MKALEAVDDDLLLTRQQVEKTFGFPTKRYLELVSQTGSGPALIRIGRLVRYRRSDVRVWLDLHREDLEP
jgi:predicted DNA-binding transcriptional regulator AlpA